MSGITIDGRPAMEQAARRIGERYGCAVLLKGGHSVQDANDLLYAGGPAALVCGQADRKPQHPRHRLHPVQRHCRQPGQRV